MARLVDVDELIDYFDGDLEGYDNREYILHMLDSKGRSARVEAIPIEWMKNKIDKLEKEYHDLFHAYTDEGVNKQVWVLNDLYAFRTVLEYWEKENEG